MSYRFTRLYLENWRNFRKVDVRLQDRIFILGPNASGKTNLLDAIRFLRDIATRKGSLVSAVEQRGGMAHLRSLHARQASQVTVKVELDLEGTRWEYELRLEGTKKQPLRIAREWIVKDGAKLLKRPGPDDRKDPRLLEQTHLEQLTQNAKFRELVDALANVVSVHVVPQVAKYLIRTQDVALRDAPGSDFIEQLASLPAKKQTGAMRRLGTLLKKAVPQFAELKIVREPRTGIPHLEAKYQHWRPKGSWQNEQEFSDGTLRLVGMLWAVLEGDAPLLLEEPELSLHEAVVKQLPRLLARAAEKNGRQIIVTTHAYEMLNDRSVDPSEVLYLVTTGEETKVHLASEDETIHSAVAAKVPLGRLVNGRTRPAGIEQMSLAFPESSSR